MKKKRKIISLLLALTTIFTSMPVFAKTIEPETTSAPDYCVTIESGNGTWISGCSEIGTNNNLKWDFYKNHKTSLPIIEYPGYVLKGWTFTSRYIDENDVTIEYENPTYYVTINSDITDYTYSQNILRPIWEKSDTNKSIFNITIDPNGGKFSYSYNNCHYMSSSNPAIFQYNPADDFPFAIESESENETTSYYVTQPIRTGYIFKGWEVESLADGTIPGEILYEPIYKTIKGYTYRALNHVYTDVTIKAKWVENNNIGNEPTEDDSNQYYTLTIDPNGGEFQYLNNDNTVVSSREPYTLRYTVGEQRAFGIKSDSSTALIGSYDYVTEPTRYGDTFLGWEIDSSTNYGEIIEDYVYRTTMGYVYIPEHHVYENIIIKAKWTTNPSEEEDNPSEEETNSYQICFDLNQGNGNISNLSFEDKFVTNELPTTIPTRTGYEFLGWGATPNSTKRIINSSETIYDKYGNAIINASAWTIDEYCEILETLLDSNNKLTLYAQWELIDYNIFLYLDDGTIDYDNPPYTIETETFSIPNPTKTGYTFKGWLKDEDMDTLYTTFSVPKGSHKDIDLTAVWEENKQIDEEPSEKDDTPTEEPSNKDDVINDTPNNNIISTNAPKYYTGTIVIGNYKYELKDGKAALKTVSKNVKKVTAPNTIIYQDIEYPVTEIKPNACKNLKKLTSVIIGKNITTIGKKSFYNCPKLKTVTIKTKNLKKIGTNAFKKCKKGIKIKIPKTKTTIYRKLLKNKY